MNRSGAIIFTTAADIALFKETIAVNPYQFDGTELTDAWEKIGTQTQLALGLGKNISARTAKNRVESRVKAYKKEDVRLLKK